MISNNIYTKSSQDQTLASKKRQKMPFSQDPSQVLSVDSMHMVCHIIASAGGAHPAHPAGTDLSICLPCLVMVFSNKYSSKERRPSKIIHQGPVYICTVNSNWFFTELNSSALIRSMIACQ